MKITPAEFPKTAAVLTINMVMNQLAVEYAAFGEISLSTQISKIHELAEARQATVSFAAAYLSFLISGNLLDLESFERALELTFREVKKEVHSTVSLLAIESCLARIRALINSPDAPTLTDFPTSVTLKV